MIGYRYNYYRRQEKGCAMIYYNFKSWQYAFDLAVDTTAVHGGMAYTRLAEVCLMMGSSPHHVFTCHAAHAQMPRQQDVTFHEPMASMKATERHSQLHIIRISIRVTSNKCMS